MLWAQFTHANLLLEFNVNSIIENQQNNASKSEKKRSVLTVTLGPDYFSYREGNKERIYDFKKYRIYTIDVAHSTYSSDSLFMDIGFRTYEFQNRLMLGGVLNAAKVEANPMAITLSEHIFSLSAKDHQSVITKKRNNQGVFFSWEGKELCSFSQKSIQIEREYIYQFVRFLRYYKGGHPEILRQLKNWPGIPSQIGISRYDARTESYDLALVSHKSVADKQYELGNLRQEKIDGELSKLVAIDQPYSQSALHNKSKHLLSEANNAFNAGNYLDSILAYLEYTLVTGEQLPNQFQSHRELIANDENVKKLLPSISPKSKEMAEKAVETLVQLRAKSKDRKHVLMIFEANIRTSLGKPETSKQLFLSALSTNPYIVGAWKDLGDLYFGSYNTRDAWRCWDLARTLVPGHRLLEPVNEFEKKLKHENPDFF